MALPSAYFELLKTGAFQGQIDPWAENGRYFNQLHGMMIGLLISQIQDALEPLGYIAGREASLTITERSKPDIYVERRTDQPTLSGFSADYGVAAASILALPGIEIEWQPGEQEAIFIDQVETGRLITVVEIVSPSNKTSPGDVDTYRDRRSRLLSQGVNILEIDLTRSFTRLLERGLVHQYPYHVAVYLPQRVPRLIGFQWGEALQRIALPLNKEVVPMELQAAYETAYLDLRTATRIQDEVAYHEDYLPFPTTLTPTQRQNALDKVAAWQAELAALRQNPG